MRPMKRTLLFLCSTSVFAISSTQKELWSLRGGVSAIMRSWWKVAANLIAKQTRTWRTHPLRKLRPS